MKPKTARFLLTRIHGFTMMDETMPPEPKLIMLGVPHSSIWDFVVAWLFARAIGGKPRVMIKQEFFFWPLGALLRSVGAIPVDRSNPIRITKQIIDAMAQSESFHLCIAPEGTRKPVKRWKTGFHTIARATGVPVYLGYFDWGKRKSAMARGSSVPTMPWPTCLPSRSSIRKRASFRNARAVWPTCNPPLQSSRTTG